MNLITTQNMKILKSQDFGYFTGGVHFLPHTMADGKSTVCTHSSKSCRAGCLQGSGKGSLTKVIESRRKKTLMFLNDQENFLRNLDAEIYYYKSLAKINNKKFAFRFNLTSDIDIQQLFLDGKTLMDIHKDVFFYDYTRNYDKTSFYSNYHLTYSYDSVNHKKALQVLHRGDNLAVVFEKELPETFMGYKVINGDLHDLTFTHGNNVVVGLKFKKIIKKDFKNNEFIKTATFVYKPNLIESFK